MERVALSWSGGKDCAMALYEIKRDSKYTVSYLLTTITRDYDRISMHGVRRELLEKQADSTGIPLKKVFIPINCTDEIYAEIMMVEMEKLKAEGIDTVAFGDIFLQDLREYRENNLGKAGMKAIFPVWKRDSGELVNTFIDLGFKATITTVDPRKVSDNFCGRLIDKQFLADLPSGVDPAGENGEFHSFAFDGLTFKKPISFAVGEKVLRDGFWFCDLIPVVTRT